MESVFNRIKRFLGTLQQFLSGWENVSTYLIESTCPVTLLPFTAIFTRVEMF